MGQEIGAVTLLVRDYDEAIRFYVDKLGFEVIEDTVLSDAKRWVLVAPRGSRGTRVLLAKAATPEQLSRVGNQTGGRVFLFLHSDDFRADYEAMRAKGVIFREQPREEEYGIVAVFEDLYGNGWDLLQLRS
ncbi:Catechol 2,3-dioxygenase [Rhizobiales bacterium GAS191]|jgi:catechol 2,3-dioxygenase-like lactoylglutathione lyase family enzyme|nr:Catechol 2,3-dioxygenase [Rhizobiales bacterium GAS113]SED59152.1 Catechol 2,3-dioxygenase [Rhizobiales bacterium GAS191]SEE77839.1 Catechol 2,3-dioxygenase [Rhizobiales bacterium GAS188]